MTSFWPSPWRPERRTRGSVPRCGTRSRRGGTFPRYGAYSLSFEFRTDDPGRQQELFSCGYGIPVHWGMLGYLRIRADGRVAGIATVRVGGSGDCGADLLAETPSGTAVIQCKFYSYPVGYDAVKEAYAAKALYKAAAHTLARPAGSPTANVPSERRSTVHAFVCTNAAYTRQARRTAQQLGVTLTNHAQIATLLGCP